VGRLSPARKDQPPLAGAAKDPPCRAKERKKEIKGSNEKSLQTQEIGKDMTNSEKYEIVGNLIESPTQYDMVRALLVCSAPGGSVSRIKDGIQIEDLAQARIDGRDMDILPELVENTADFW
jgi:hypothetical protein